MWVTSAGSLSSMGIPSPEARERSTVEVGATIAERFRVQTVTEDAVLLSSIGGDKQVRLPLAVDAAPAPKR